MLTDGFVDQMHGVTRKKFTRKGLKQLLDILQDMPMNDQRQKIEATYYEWKGFGEQIDDILFLGFEI